MTEFVQQRLAYWPGRVRAGAAGPLQVDGCANEHVLLPGLMQGPLQVTPSCGGSHGGSYSRASDLPREILRPALQAIVSWQAIPDADGSPGDCSMQHSAASLETLLGARLFRARKPCGLKFDALGWQLADEGVGCDGCGCIATAELALIETARYI